MLRSYGYVRCIERSDVKRLRESPLTVWGFVAFTAGQIRDAIRADQLERPVWGMLMDTISQEAPGIPNLPLGS